MKLRKNLTFDTSAYYIADCASYTERIFNGLVARSSGLPESLLTINEAKELLDSDVKMTPCKDLRYGVIKIINLETWSSTRSKIEPMANEADPRKMWSLIRLTLSVPKLRSMRNR